jgi:uncharacterized protein (DUF305 family)
LTDRRRRIAVVLAAAALLGAAAAGCSGEDGGREPSAAGSTAVIAPGAPGEEARTLSPQEAREAAEAGTEPNEADFAFVRMMIEHHAQALVMTDLAGDRAGDERVRRLAARVAAAQGPETEAMSAWLLRNAGAAADSDGEAHGGHGTADAMPGMASEEQLDALRAARGAAFDALFVELMTAHHEGGVAMAEGVLAEGNDETVAQLATDLIAEQSVEIERMRALG